MSQLNDVVFLELGSRGFTGSLNDREYAWLGSLGYTGTHNDRWYAFLGDQGFTGTLNDRKHAYLLTFNSKPFHEHVNDLEMGYWVAFAGRSFDDSFDLSFN